MSKVETGAVDPAISAKQESFKNISWKHFAPVVVTVLVALIPAPAGLPQYAWYYFAIFVGVIVGLMFEPLPGGAIGVIGVTLVTVLSEYVFFSPEQLAKAGFNAARASLSWALSGFSNTTVWLIFGAFMFALGYDKTGLGRRIALLLVKAMGRKTLTLGYAVTIADTLLAPFTPSNTARSGGTIYPVIRNLPPLYDSQPNDPSMRRVGSYIMWVAIAATCVTSSMFLTGLAPNLLAVELVRKTAKIELDWVSWFVAFAPVGILLLARLLDLSARSEAGRGGADLGRAGAREDGSAQLARDHVGDPRRHRAAAVDFRRQNHGGHHCRDRRDIAHADPQCGHLGRYHGE
jgi:di/tricarboxylate transporter